MFVLMRCILRAREVIHGKFLFLACVFEGPEVWARDQLQLRAPGIKTPEPGELPKPTSFCERMWGRFWFLGLAFK